MVSWLSLHMGFFVLWLGATVPGSRLGLSLLLVVARKRQMARGETFWEPESGAEYVG